MTAFRVQRLNIGQVTMSDGHQETGVIAYIFADGRRVAGPIHLHCAQLCLPEGTVCGVYVTDDQIVRAVLGDEDIITGRPTFPEFYDEVTRG